MLTGARPPARAAGDDVPETPAGVAHEVEHGYTFGSIPLWVAGWATLEGDVPESGPATLGIGDVGLLARYELTPRFSLFGEVDLDDTVTLVESSGLERGSRVLLLERLYLEWTPTDALTVRVGKFLTPFGIWNVIRRAPLTWTVDRPTATQSAFPEHTTGASLTYQTTHRGWTLDALAYGQAQDELARGTADTSATAVGGARTVAGHALGPGYAALGISGVAWRNADTHRWEDAYGADVDLALWGTELTGELAYSRLREKHASREWSFYLQDVVPLYRTLYGVLRVEHVEARIGPTTNGVLLGLAWRPTSYTVLKADYQFADREGDPRAASALERGFAASFTVYF